MQFLFIPNARARSKRCHCIISTVCSAPVRVLSEQRQNSNYHVIRHYIRLSEILDILAPIEILSDPGLRSLHMHVTWATYCDPFSLIKIRHDVQVQENSAVFVNRPQSGRVDGT